MNRVETLIVLTLALTGGTALAQPVMDTVGEQETDNTQRGKPGYYAGRIRILPKVSISGTYNDNIYATDRETVSDFITVVRPTLQLRSEWDRHSIRFDIGAAVGSYWDNPEEDYADYWLNFQGRHDFSETTNLFGGLGYSKLHEGRDSPDATLAGISPTTYQSQNAHLGLSHSVDRWTLRFGGTYDKLDYDNVPTIFGGILDNDDRDRTLSGAGLRASYKLQDGSALFAQLLFDKRDYRLPTDSLGYQRDSDGYRAALGIKRKLGAMGELEAYIGALSQSYDDPRFSDLNKPDFYASMALYPTVRSKLTAKLRRDLHETTQAGAAGYIYTAIDGRYEHSLLPKLVGHLSASYGQADYLDVDREDKNLSFGVGIKYQLSADLYLAADYLRVRRDSNDETLSGNPSLRSNDFEQDLFFVTLGVSPYPKTRRQVANAGLLGEIELGAIYLGEDSLRFGNYTGLTDKGFYGLLNVDALARVDGRDRARLRIENGGLDSRSILFSWFQRGSYRAYTTWDELPSYQFPALTVFNGVDTPNLTLPTDWFDSTPPPINSTRDMDKLGASLRAIDIGTKRKQLAVGGDFRINALWQMNASYKNVKKQGLDVIGGPVGTSPGNTRSALLPEPVDWNDHQLDLGLNYSGAQGQIGIAYHGSFFQNAYRALSWESPFSDLGNARYSDGLLALSPDKQFHQISLSGNYLLSPESRTRLTGVYAYGLMLQDDDFLPYTINPGGIANTLPADSLDGRIKVQNAKLTLVSHPVKDLRLNAAYRFNERDNKSDSLSFDYITADSNTNATTTVINQPYGYQKHTFNLEGKYRLQPKADFVLGYDYERMLRDNAERDRTDEDIYRAELRLRPMAQLQAGIRLAHANRDGSAYQPMTGENPLLRKYNMADRERDTAGIDLTYFPKDTITVSAALASSRDDYTDTAVGLRGARRDNFSIDTSVQLSQELSTHAFYSWERIRSDQAGSETPVDPDWKADYDDRIQSIGVGLKQANAFKPGLDLSVDYVLSDASGSVDVNAPNSLVPVKPFPDFKTRVHTLKLTANYRVKRSTSLRMGYLYERYSSDDWAVDGVYPDSLRNVLTIGAEAPNYNQHVVWASLVYKF